MQAKIRPAKVDDARAIQRFADLNIGEGYYSVQELEDKLKQSISKDQMCSFVLEDQQDGSIQAFRLTFPPGRWSHGKGQGLLPGKWGVPLHEVAYFQSLFLAPAAAGQGWGPKLSLASIEVLERLSAKGIVTHSWVESPHQSSKRYLEKLGFKTVGFHSHYWYEVDYECTRCGRPCTCTAEEMFLKLPREKGAFE